MQFFCKLIAAGKKFGARVGSAFERALLATRRMLSACKRLVIRPLLSGLLACAKRMPRVFAAVIAVIVLIVGTTVVALATDATAAFDVMYQGSSLGTVKDASVLAEAEILAAKKLNNIDCNRYLIETSLSQTIVAADRLLDASALADIMIAQSDEITTAAVLCIEGNQVAMEQESASIDSALADYLVQYQEEKGMDSVAFGAGIEVLQIYTPKSTFEQMASAADYLEAHFDTLPMQSVTHVVETRSIAYQTVKTTSTKYTAGTEVVTQEGVDGVEEVTYQISVVNGVAAGKTEISSRVVQEPVECHVTVGTKRIIAADKNGTAPMLWPLQRVSTSYVSSYVGDGRGHKGMDIAAPAGTPIYAAEGGTVITAGKSGSGYGNYIVIRHNNGLETLYAHCSALYVTQGETVAAGEHIAAVGRTGNSTGNHLHFEVHKNGVFVDPANYIGSN